MNSEQYGMIFNTTNGVGTIWHKNKKQQNHWNEIPHDKWSWNSMG